MIVGFFGLSLLVVITLFAQMRRLSLILLGVNLLLVLALLWHLMTVTIPINW